MQSFTRGIGSFLRNPIGVVVLINLLWHGVVWFFGIPFNYITSLAIFIIDFAAVYYLLDRLTYFFSQFVLPIQNQNDRKEIFERVRNFLGDNRGPAIFIKNGEVIEHEGESDRTGLGVVLLDTASAAVLRTSIEFKQTIGPGVNFTKPQRVGGKVFNVFVADSVDLRIQWQFIGPRANEITSPLIAAKKHKISPTSVEQTIGTTRDNIDVSPTISIKFRIKRPEINKPTESGVTSNYLYDPEAVRNSIVHEVVQLGIPESKKPRLEWDKFPEHLVVNLWREYIRKFKLAELFSSDSSNPSGIQFIEEMINKRVKRKFVEGLDDTGENTQERVDSREYQQLQVRGLEILDVRIHDVYMEQVHEEQICGQWNADWIKMGKKDEVKLNEKEALLKTNARNEAVKQFARLVTAKFENPIAPTLDPYALLQELIHPLKEQILNKSQDHGEAMEEDLKKLDNILKWLLVNKFIYDNQKRRGK